MGTGYHGGFGATRGSAYKKTSSSNPTPTITISFRKEDIVESLLGVTEASTLVAELIRDKKIGVNILGDELFEATLDKNKIKDPKNVSGYQDGSQIHIRRSSLKGYSVFVHEGTHAYDYLNSINNPDSANIINPASYQGEFRAFMNEHEFQIKKGEHVEFKDEGEIRVHIRLNYEY